MVALDAIRASNKSIASTFTAVFVGATSGIGLGAVEALLKSAINSKIYLIARSQSKFAPTLAKLKSSNPSAMIIFIEAQIALLKEVDRTCTLIKAHETRIDLLWLSQGGLPEGHKLTSEGLFEFLAIAIYSRVLLMCKLMPLLNKGSNPRAVSVLTASHEGAINTIDMGLPSNMLYQWSETLYRSRILGVQTYRGLVH